MPGINDDQGPYHTYDIDDGFDWKALNECCDWFPKQLHRYARFNLASCKEKYGTMRFEYLGLCHGGLYGLIWPGRLFFHLRWPTRRKITKYGDYDSSILLEINNIITAIAAKCGLQYTFKGYQRLIFNIITVVAVRKYPQIQKEITDDIEFRDLLYSYTKKLINYKCYWRSL